MLLVDDSCNGSPKFALIMCPICCSSNALNNDDYYNKVAVDDDDDDYYGYDTSGMKKPRYFESKNRFRNQG